MTQHVVVLLIMDMESAKSDVIGGQKKKVICYFVLESETNLKNMFQKHIDLIYNGSD